MARRRRENRAKLVWLLINFDEAGEPVVDAYLEEEGEKPPYTGRYYHLILTQHSPDDPYTFEADHQVPDDYEGDDELGTQERRDIARMVNTNLRRKYPSLSLIDIEDPDMLTTFRNKDEYLLFKMSWIAK